MNNVLRWLRYTFIGAEKPPNLDEAHYPRDAKGTPDLTRFTRHVAHYARYIDDYLESLDSPRGASILS